VIFENEVEKKKRM